MSWRTRPSQYDRIVWLGHDPAGVLHDVLGVARAAHFLSLVYVAWTVLVPVTLVIAVVWSRERVAGAWYVTAVAVDWVLGGDVLRAADAGSGARRSAGLRGAPPHVRVDSAGVHDRGPLRRGGRPLRQARGADDRGVRLCTSGSR